jgi:hypothetical protein
MTASARQAEFTVQRVMSSFKLLSLRPPVILCHCRRVAEACQCHIGAWLVTVARPGRRVKDCRAEVQVQARDTETAVGLGHRTEVLSGLLHVT